MTKKWQHYERHPLSAEYRDLSGTEFDAFVEQLRTNGIMGERKITLHEGMVLDGWQLYRGCLEADLTPKFATLPDDVDPEAFVEAMNDRRRHENPETLREHAARRRERVAKLREAGKSTRAIAEAEGVSQQQVLRDIKASIDTGVSVEPPSGKVTGKDGKKRDASKPIILCARCQRVGAVAGCNGCKEARKVAKKTKKKTKTTDPLKDAFGNEIPQRCRDVWADTWIQDTFDTLALMAESFRKKRMADGMQKRAKRLPFFNSKDFIDGLGQIDHNFDLLIGHIKDQRPAGVCPKCEGKGCGHCKNSGLVPRELYKQLGGKC